MNATLTRYILGLLVALLGATAAYTVNFVANEPVGSIPAALVALAPLAVLMVDAIRDALTRYIQRVFGGDEEAAQ